MRFLVIWKCNSLYVQCSVQIAQQNSRTPFMSSYVELFYITPNITVGANPGTGTFLQISREVGMQFNCVFFLKKKHKSDSKHEKSKSEAKDPKPLKEPATVSPQKLNKPPVQAKAPATSTLVKTEPAKSQPKPSFPSFPQGTTHTEPVVAASDVRPAIRKFSS